MKRTLRSFVSLAFVVASISAVSAQSSTASTTGSALSAMGSATLVMGSVQMLSAGPNLTVASVNVVGDVATIVLRGASSAAQFSVQLSAAAAQTASEAG